MKNSRKNRKNNVESELSKVFKNIEPNRFNAIKNINGAIGCSLSHLHLLQYAKKNNLSN